MTTVLESLNTALHRAMERDSRVVLLGEDLLDPYGGAFKVTRGLSTRFPERVLTTPISEAAIMGFANGLALRGMRPVVEIMFGDFVTLIADQLVNHAAKFAWMYNGQVKVPLVVRTPMGGRRGYGPTHSQSLEKLFMGVPGIKVVAPSALHDAGGLLETAIADEAPVFFAEHKLLYPRPLLQAGQGPLMDYQLESSGGTYPTLTLRLPDLPPQITLVTYGYNLELAREAAWTLLMEYEVAAELVVYTQLSPFDPTPALRSLQRTGRLLTVEEGTRTLGWGAEVLAALAESGVDADMRRVAARDLPIPNSPLLEAEILPDSADILAAARALLGLED